ncbi:TPA: hypothetical protein ACJOOC_001557 [Streptococcus pyogenes]
MTLVDDFYKRMKPSIKKFLDNNIIITDQEEAIRVYKSVKYYKKLNRLPPPDVLEWFQQIYTTEEMVALIKQSYRLKQKKTDEGFSPQNKKTSTRNAPLVKFKLK